MRGPRPDRQNPYLEAPRTKLPCIVASILMSYAIIGDTPALPDIARGVRNLLLMSERGLHEGALVGDERSRWSNLAPFASSRRGSRTWLGHLGYPNRLAGLLGENVRFQGPRVRVRYVQDWIKYNVLLWMWFGAVDASHVCKGAAPGAFGSGRVHAIQCLCPFDPPFPYSPGLSVWLHDEGGRAGTGPLWLQVGPFI